MGRCELLEVNGMNKLRRRLSALGVKHVYDEEHDTVEARGWTFRRQGTVYFGYRPTDLLPSWEGTLYDVLCLFRPPASTEGCGYCGRNAYLYCNGCRQALCVGHKVCPGCESAEEVFTYEDSS